MRVTSLNKSIMAFLATSTVSWGSSRSSPSRHRRHRSYKCPTQVLPWALLFVPSGQMVLDQITSLTLVPLSLHFSAHSSVPLGVPATTLSPRTLRASVKQKPLGHLRPFTEGLRRGAPLSKSGRPAVGEDERRTLPTTVPTALKMPPTPPN
jgi:hypothetical protein